MGDASVRALSGPDKYGAEMAHPVEAARLLARLLSNDNSHDALCVEHGEQDIHPGLACCCRVACAFWEQESK